MATSPDRIKEEALGLEPQDRADLAHRLIRSLDEQIEDPVEVERAWAEEIRRRLTRLEAGEAKLIAVEDVLRKARSQIA